MNAHDLVVARADAHCEVMAPVRGLHTRCGLPTTEVHHKLTRSRGGDVLDTVAETYHLICICRSHHHWVHTHPGLATQTGLYLLGQAWLEIGQVVYRGPDEFLTRRYGSEVRSAGGAGRQGRAA